MARPIEAAGGVVFRKNDAGQREYLVVHRPGYDDWSLPKGKLDGGESFAEAAQREVTEETGFTTKIKAPLGVVGYWTPARNRKVVHYYLMRAKSGKFKKNSEVDRIRWLTPVHATARLSYDIDRAVVLAAHQRLEKPPRNVVFLVRHGNAYERGKWKRDDTKRPISKKGARQAAAIAKTLSATPLARVMSSPLRRCVQTVRPLADFLDTKVETESALSEGSSPELVLKLIRQIGTERAVLCSHRDVISATLGMLHAEGTPFAGPLEWPKGSIWALEVVDGRVVSGEPVSLA